MKRATEDRKPVVPIVDGYCFEGNNGVDISQPCHFCEATIVARRFMVPHRDPLSETDLIMYLTVTYGEVK